MLERRGDEEREHGLLGDSTPDAQWSRGHPRENPPSGSGRGNSRLWEMR